MHLDLLGRDVKEFPSVDRPSTVITAKLWNCPFDASPVARFENLQGLEIFSLRDASREFLVGLKMLSYLYVIHLPKVSSLDGLCELPALEVLRLHTLPSWDSSGKRTVVPSIKPIARLPSLRHLELFSVVPVDRSLAPLEASTMLMTARFQGFPKQEVSRFQAVTGLPDTYAPLPDWASP